jgi:hypothetical protein
MAKMQDPVPNLEFEPEEEEESLENQELEVFVKGRDVIPEEPKEDDDLPEDYRNLSKKELVEMLMAAKAGSDTASALQAAIQGLGDKISRPSPTPQPQMPVQQPGESSEEFAKRVNQALFGENPYAVLKEVITREVAPLLSGLQNQSVQTAKQLLLRDEEKGPIFRKYKDEVEAMVASMPPEHRNNPGVYEFALNQIQVKHMDEIISDKVKAALEGKAEEPQVVVRKPQVSQGTTSRGSLAPKTTKKRVVIDEAKALELERKGIDLKDYIRMNGA